MDSNKMVEKYIEQRLEYLWFMAQAHFAHEVMWGVPCGPTLTMVYPTRLLSAEEFFGEEPKLLTFKEAYWSNNDN